MERIVECVPNISEGRRKEVVEAVVNEVRSTANVTLLDYSSDDINEIADSIMKYQKPRTTLFD